MVALPTNGAVLIKTDGSMSPLYPENGSTFVLEEAQKAVDGLIEVVNLNEKIIFIVNEEGKFTKEPNPVATLLAQVYRAIVPRDYIAGDCILCPSVMLP